MCVTFTPAATRFMQRMLRLSGAGPGAGFRLSVKEGGCSGFDSSFSVEAGPRSGDTVIQEKGVTLFLPADTCALLAGYTIDFIESRLEGGFSFTNPNKSASCGCGSGQGLTAQVVRFRPGTCRKA
ncbi:MAG: iron-sulfur cluster assembly accessory protein [Betaproteobacteria bacterium]|nr:iron-sulfur cluster assembly accessory protein [Betaproteobacteria bacterium]